MAKHKAPTQVTILREEKSLMHAWVDRYWKTFAALAVALTAVLLYRTYSAEQARAQMGSEWAPLDQAVREGDRDKLAAIRTEAAGTPIADWATFAEGQVALSSGESAEAAAAFKALEGTQDPVLGKLALPIGPDGAEVTIASHLASASAAQAEWEAANPILDNPAPSADAPKVVLETDKGDIELTLYTDKAPIHAQNYIKLAKEGFFDGTLFHRVVNTPTMKIIQGGDPNSKEGEPTTWGQGGPGYDQTPEQNGLIHARGYLSAAAPGAGARSSGSQFFLTLGSCHFLDTKHTVFGKITGGMEIAETILRGEIRPPEGTLRDIPVEPVKVLRTRVEGA